MTTTSGLKVQNRTPPFVLNSACDGPSSKVSSSSSRTGCLIAQGSPVEVFIISHDPKNSVKEFSLNLQFKGISSSTTRESTQTLTFKDFNTSITDKVDLCHGSMVTKASFTYKQRTVDMSEFTGPVSQIWCSFFPNNDVCLKVVCRNEMAEGNFDQSNAYINYFSLKSPVASHFSNCSLYRGEPSKCTTGRLMTSREAPVNEMSR